MGTGLLLDYSVPEPQNHPEVTKQQQHVVTADNEHEHKQHRQSQMERVTFHRQTIRTVHLGS